MATLNPVIRSAAADDLPAVLSHVRELAIYERAEHKLSADLDVYRKSFEKGHFEAFVAVLNDEVVGTAIYYRRFSTWKGPILYLEDLVVREKYRRMGIGTMLFEAYVDEAKRRNMAMCLWQVLDWNQPAIDFYNKYDVEYDDDWLNVKIYFR